MNQAPAKYAPDDLKTEITSSATETKTEPEIHSGLENRSPVISDPTTKSEPSSLLSKEAQNEHRHSNTPDEGEPNLDLIMKIPVEVQVILGTAKMPVSRLMKLGRNAVIALDRQVGDPIDVVVNGRIVARGEVVLMEDDSSRFGISLTALVGPNECEK